MPAPTETVPEPTSPSSFPYRRLFDGLAFAIFLGIVLGFFWFTHRFAVNVVYYDQFSDINVIKHADSGTLSWSVLWAQHNENRVLFPNFVALLLAATTHLNIVVEDYLSGLLLMAATALLILAHKRRSPSVPWILYCPVALVLAMFGSLHNSLFGFNLSWYLVVFGMALALFLLDRVTLSRWVLVGAIAAAVVGSYSSLQGLIIWPSGLVLLYLRKRSGRAMLTWIVSAVVTTAIYLYHFDFVASGGTESSTLSHPTQAFRFFFSSIGNVFGTNLPSSPTAVNNRAFAVGVVVFILAVWALVRGFRRDRSDGGPLGIALICFGLLFVMFITLGRTQQGLTTEGRYSVFVLTLWIGTYLTLLEPTSPLLSGTREVWMARLDRLARVTPPPGGPGPEQTRLTWSQGVTLAFQFGLIGLMLAQIFFGSNAGIGNADGWRHEEIEVADVSANIDQASPGLIQRVLGNYPSSFERQMVVFSRSKRLSLFNTPLATELERQGIFPSLLSRMVTPHDGAHLSGPALLGVLSDIKPAVHAVEFRITGASLHAAINLPATSSYVGHFATWDTAKVANGRYEVRAVFHLGGASRILSPSISVLVRNPSRHGT